MATPSTDDQNTINGDEDIDDDPNNAVDDEDEDEDEDNEEDDLDDEEDDAGEDEKQSPETRRRKAQSFFHRLSSAPVRIYVHDVIIKGNTKTKDALIEAEVLSAIRSAATMQELLKAATAANARLRRLDIFDSVNITLDAGPPELPGTANVIIDVVEAKNPINGDIGVFTKPEARSWSLEGSVRYKNLFGHGDIWNTSLVYGWDQSSQISAGFSLPRFKALSHPVRAQFSLLSQDWLKFSSYKERLLGLSFGLLSTRYHDLAYNLTWRTLTDPTRMSSRSIRSQLGHSLLSSIKYTFKIDQRDSHVRPTRGYAFVSTSQIGGLGPDSKLMRFFRQEFDLRAALPLGFCNTAVNFGVSAGAIFPWGKGFMSLSSPVPDRFYMGGPSSPVCSMVGPTSLLGFKLRGLGPTDARRIVPPVSGDAAPGAEDFNDSLGRDSIGGDLAVTAFADLSFDFPLKLFKEAGVHGHVFVNAGNLVKLTDNEFKNLSFRNFLETFRSSAGCGVVFPTRFFRMEVNYCYILRQFQNDHAKTGIQFSFST